MSRVRKSECAGGIFRCRRGRRRVFDDWRTALGVVPLVVTFVILGGCTVLGPGFTTPEPSIQDAWIADQEPKISHESADFGTWWTAFNDPVLDSLTEMARNQNLPLRIVGVRILEARARLGIAIGNQYPQVQDATADYRRFKQSDKCPGVWMGCHWGEERTPGLSFFSIKNFRSSCSCG